MWNKHHTQTKTETGIRKELFDFFSAQKWHRKYCSRIPGTLTISGTLDVAGSESCALLWQLKITQVHRSVSANAQICVDVLCKDLCRCHTICKTSWSCQVTKWSHTFRVHLEWASNIRRRTESQSTRIFWCVTYQKSMDTGGFQNYAWAIDPFKGPFIYYVIQIWGPE